MLKRILTGMLVLFSLYAFPASGDMGRITTSEATVHENSQKAIIIHNLDEEILILGTGLVSDRKTQTLRFIPFPSEPTVSLAQGDPFERVSELIRNHGLTFLEKGTKGGTSSGSPVELRFNAQLGVHDVTLVKINEIGEFRRWVEEFLAGKGLAPSQDYQKVVEVASDYVQRGFSYFVFDLVEIGPEMQFTEPVAYRFKSKKLFYPLKTSNTFGGEGGIDLILVSPVTLCDPLHSESLPLEDEASIYISSLTEEETIMRKLLGGDAMLVSTSAQISRQDLQNIDKHTDKFFQENEPVFMQLIHYWGKYSFDDDIHIDISQAPREIIDEWNAGDSLPFDYSAFREIAKSSKPKPPVVADEKGTKPNQQYLFRAACETGDTDAARTLVARSLKPTTEDIDFCLHYGHKETAVYLNEILEEEGGRQVDIKKRCYMEAKPGSCKANFDIVYFDMEAKACKTYRGCDESPFHDLGACKKICEE